MANSDDKSLPDQALEALLYAPIGIAYEVLDRLPTWVARGKSQATITKVLGKMAVQKGQSELEDVVSDIFGVKLGEHADGAQNGAGTKKAPPSSPKTATVKASTSKTASKSGIDATSPTSKTNAKTAKSDKDAAARKTAKPTKKATAAKSAKSAKSSKSAKTGKATKATKTTKTAKTTKTSKTSKKAKPTKAAAVATDAASAVPVETELALASYGSMPASQIVKRLDSLSANQLEAIRMYEEANRHRVTVLNRIRQIQRSA